MICACGGSDDGETLESDSGQTSCLPDRGQPLRRVAIGEFLDVRAKEPSHLGPTLTGQKPGAGRSLESGKWPAAVARALVIIAS